MNLSRYDQVRLGRHLAGTFDRRAVYSNCDDTQARVMTPRRAVPMTVGLLAAVLVLLAGL